MLKEFIFCLYDHNSLMYEIEIKKYFKTLIYSVGYVETNGKIKRISHKLLSYKKSILFSDGIENIKLENKVDDYYVHGFNYVDQYCWRLYIKINSSEDTTYLTGKDSYPLFLNLYLDEIRKIDKNVQVCDKYIFK